ncbi:hypothetical protein BTRA_2836 [Burkholderia thailandensis USAMRU Malaysia |nr:hypothetical protein BTQ_1190 [Burkholderia thailandensis 2002721723]AHI78409.1 hypothetical protein BTJ_1244 [Burkholderia thailandensis E444]AIC87895.1 hypothetical protein BTRA_2836 [Burkholderia thailandensis USAMRU Malaysia \
MVPGTGLEPASQLRRRIFVTLLLSKPAPRGAVRALDYAFAIAHKPCCRSCALGAPRLVSTPSPPPLFRPLRGLARRCLGASRARGFAEFEGFCTGRFRPGTQSFKSAMFTNFITPARADAILPLLARAFPIRPRKCSPITRDPAPSASAPRARRIDQVSRQTRAPRPACAVTADTRHGAAATQPACRAQSGPVHRFAAIEVSPHAASATIA